MTHEFEPNKHHYRRKDIVANFDIDPIIDAKAIINKAKYTKNDVILYLIQCADGIIREYDLELKVPDVLRIQNETQLRAACASYAKKRGDEIVKNKETFEVIYVHGSGGSGKSTLCTEYCRQQILSFYITDDGDPMGNYRGEDCIILDDFRSSTMSYHALLKFLDSRNRSSATARYRNKLFIGEKIFITSPLPLDKLYVGVQARNGEDKNLTQLRRRISNI